MTSKWTGYYKIVQQNPTTSEVTDNHNIGSPGSYGAYNWYHRIIQGSSSRLTRYRDWDLMDVDIDISRALDLIAEEITGNKTKEDDSLIVTIDSHDNIEINSNMVTTLNVALRHWCNIHDWDNRLFYIARYMIKYGDVFFKKIEGKTKWRFVHPKDVISAVVDSKDITDIIGWYMRANTTEVNSSMGVPVSYASSSVAETEYLKDGEVVRCTLNDDMSDSAPFGESVLKPVFKTFKQKELLEDAVVIYRIQRAPERRVFYIDVGKMPPPRIKQYLEEIKNEIKQKKIPTYNGRKSEIDAVYNPQCISLDTIIPLIDGRKLALSEIITEYKDGKELWAYSCNPDTGEIVPGKIDWAGVTRKNTEVINLTFDNGKTLICTPDHMIPVQGKGFIQAQYLTENDSLIPFNSRMGKVTNKPATYEEVYDISKNEWVFTNRLVANYMKDNGEESVTIINEACYDNYRNPVYNHIVTKIERLDNMDTGCITVDKGEKYHNYHTFAVDSGVFIKNSQNEDFFLAQRSDGSGSKIETLPGGQNLGSIEDLEYFGDKVFRGLRIPLSYMKEGDGGNALFNDGKLGQSYIVELRFALYIQRLQASLERVMDEEFKSYLKNIGINYDNSLFNVKLPEPSNFGKYREQEMDAALLSTFGSADALTFLSKKFSMKRYLKLTDEEILENERMKLVELGHDPDNYDHKILAQIYAPDSMMGGNDMGMGMGGGSDLGMGGGLSAGDMMKPEGDLGGEVGGEVTI